MKKTGSGSKVQGSGPNRTRSESREFLARNAVLLGLLGFSGIILFLRRQGDELSP